MTTSPAELGAKRAWKKKHFILTFSFALTFLPPPADALSPASTAVQATLTSASPGREVEFVSQLFYFPLILPLISVFWPFALLAVSSQLPPAAPSPMFEHNLTA